MPLNALPPINLLMTTTLTMEIITMTTIISIIVKPARLSFFINLQLTLKIIRKPFTYDVLIKILWTTVLPIYSLPMPDQPKPVVKTTYRILRGQNGR